MASRVIDGEEQSQPRPEQQSRKAATSIAAAGWTRRATGRSRAAAAAAARSAAGVFLWSRRNQISDQLCSLSDQISEWREGMTSAASSDWLDDTAD